MHPSRSRSASLALASLLAAALVPSLAAADPGRDQVESLLAGYEPRVSAADLARLGPGTDRVLIAIASDPATSPLRRVRALAALSAVPSTDGREACRAVVAARRAAAEGAAALELAACAHTLGASPGDPTAELGALLDHPVIEVRVAAARALGQSRGVPPARAQALVRRRARVENDGFVRGVLDESLRRLGRR